MCLYGFCDVVIEIDMMVVSGLDNGMILFNLIMYFLDCILLGVVLMLGFCFMVFLLDVLVKLVLMIVLIV